jgi:hypothetical protein
MTTPNTPADKSPKEFLCSLNPRAPLPAAPAAPVATPASTPPKPATDQKSTGGDTKQP